MAHHSGSTGLTTLIPMRFREVLLFMVMTVSRMKKFIRVSFATAWDARWSPMIFLTDSRRLSKNRNAPSCCGYTGNSNFLVRPFNSFCLVVVNGQGNGFGQLLWIEGFTICKSNASIQATKNTLPTTKPAAMTQNPDL